MKYPSSNNVTAATCLSFAFLFASSTFAENDAAPDDEHQDASEPIIHDVSPEISQDVGKIDDEAAFNQQTDQQESLEKLELITLDADSDLDEDPDHLDDEPAGVQQTDRESDLEELRLGFSLYKSAIANGSYDEADTLAKSMVELAIRLFGLDSHESAKALTNLGLVQQRNKDYESAVLNFTSSINIIERIEDRLNIELINPLRGLGSAQLGSGRPGLAKRAFDRAVHVSHVNEGPHNLMQIRILEDLAETYLTMGDSKKALGIYKFIYNLEAHNADLDSEEILPALERQALWMHRMRIYEQERQTWRRIINILERNRGKKDLSLVQPLTGLGTSYLYVGDFQADFTSDRSLASGDTYLKRAIRIVESNPDAPWSTMQESLVVLGDYYTLSSRSNKARRIYQQAWGILSDGDERLQVRKETLEELRILQNINPPKYYKSTRTDNGEDRPDSFETGTITVGYMVTNRGLTRDVEVIDADPAGLEEMEYSLTREMRHLIHRPRMENGETVETPNQTYTHEFYYRRSDLPKADKEETVTEAVEAIESEEEIVTDADETVESEEETVTDADETVESEEETVTEVVEAIESEEP